MIVSTSRSRLYELRRDRVAAARSAELLERKREVLLRETAARIAKRDALREKVTRALSAAQHKLAIARVHHGRERIAAAALAQPLACTIESRELSIMGVRLVELRAVAQPFRAMYGAAATSQALDDAAVAFDTLLPDVIRLAGEEHAVSRLRLTLRKTTKLVNALQKIVLPRLDHDIRVIIDSIEEEERDEAVRRKVWLRRTTSRSVRIT